jgi:hypothetical protein
MEKNQNFDDTPKKIIITSIRSEGITHFDFFYLYFRNKIP